MQTARDKLNEEIHRLISIGSTVDAVHVKRIVQDTIGAEVFPKYSTSWLMLIDLHDRLAAYVLSMGPSESPETRKARRSVRRQELARVATAAIHRWRLRDDPHASEITSELVAGDVVSALGDAGLA